ncbi:hypothetical protein GCM10023107_82670 [Actinoplanes octamycinicus]|nr:hypothetical protein Aoc01nite_35530 [Actinoplanes octamycinicus]
MIATALPAGTASAPATISHIAPRRNGAARWNPEGLRNEKTRMWLLIGFAPAEMSGPSGYNPAATGA